MKKAVFLFFLFVLLVVVSLTFRRKTESVTTPVEKKPMEVETRLVGSSREAVLNFSFPAVVKSEREVLVKSKSAGQVAWLNFEIGDSVNAGDILVKIDAAGNLSAGENNFLSNQIQQQEFLVKELKKSYDLAKENYRNNDSKSNEIAKKVAKLQYQAAQVALRNLLNDALLTAPLSGIVMEKMVSVGDTVSAGQTIAKINQSGKIQVQFFVDSDLVQAIKKGDNIEVELGDGKIFPAVVSLVSPEADSSSKKFKIEADIVTKENIPLRSIVTVFLKIKKQVKEDSQFYLPLSAVTVGQDESFVFIIENGQAKKVKVKIEKIIGESVLVTADLDNQSAVIIEGNKQVQDGAKVTIKQ